MTLISLQVLLGVVVLNSITAFGATCVQADQLACISSSGAPASPCLTTDPSTCTTAICDAAKWLSYFQCLQARCTMAAPRFPCDQTYQVCDATFRSQICSLSTTGVPGAVTTTAAPPVPTSPPTFAPGNTGLSGSWTTTPIPTSVTWGSVVGRNGTSEGCSQLLGLLTAFNEVNSNGGINGIMQNLVWGNDNSDQSGLTALSEMQRLVNQQQIFGMMLAPGTASALGVAYATALNLPYVGPVPTDPVSTYVPGKRAVINMRFAFINELYAQLNFFLNSKTHCKRFGVIYLELSFVPDFVSQLDQLIINRGFPKMVRAKVALPGATTLAGWTTYVDQLFSGNASTYPNCIFGYLTFTMMPNVTQAIIGHSLYRRGETFISTIGLGAPDQPVSIPVSQQSDYANFFVTQTLPYYQGDTPSAKRFRSIVTAMVPQMVNYGCPATTPISQGSFGSYLGARLAFEIFKRLKNYTRSEFIDSVYTQRMFQLDEIVLGPYSDQCDSTSKNLPCWCNSGTRAVFMIQLNGSTGYFSPLGDNISRGEFGVARAEAALSQCNLDPSFITVPILLSYVPEASGAKSSSLALGSSLLRLSPSLTRLIVGLNYQQQAAYSRVFVLGPGSVPATTAIRTTQATALADRYSFFAAIEPVGATPALGATSSGMKIRLPEDWTTMPYVDPTIPSNGAYAAGDVYFFPVLADYIHTLVAFYARSLRSDSSNLYIITDNAIAANCAVKSLNTFGLVPARTFMVSNAADVGNAFQELPVTSMVLVASQTPTIVVAAVFASSATSSNVTWLIATHERILEDPTATAVAIQRRVYFASAFPAWWGSSPASTFVQQVLSLADSASYVENQIATGTGFVSPRGNLTALDVMLSYVVLALSQGALNSGDTTPSAFLEWWFQPSSKGIGDLQLGPLSSQRCLANSATLCDCNKLLRGYSVHRLSDMYSHSSPSVNFRYAHEGCGATYRPLPEEPTNWTGLIVGLSVGGVALLALVGFIIVKATAPVTRDNGLAPKTSDLPFAIVFTDIQSSTHLWAEAPEEMSEAMGIHHDVIRKLVGKHKGYEVKTIGDSFMVAFQDPKDAILFSMSIQEALLEQDWNSIFNELYQDDELQNSQALGMTKATAREELFSGLRVRIGVHFGLGEVKFDPVTLGYDYYGTVVNCAARVESVGHGGQVLITDAVKATALPTTAAADSLNLVVTPLGLQTLRGLANPVELYQVLPKKLAARTFPPLRLDKADDADESNFDPETSSLQSASEAASHLSAQGLAELLARTMWRSNVEAATENILQTTALIKVLLSTSDAKYRASFIHHVGSKWRVTAQAKAEKDPEPTLIRVVAKVIKSLEVKQTLPRRGSGRTSVSEGGTADTPSHGSRAFGKAKYRRDSSSEGAGSVSNTVDISRTPGEAPIPHPNMPEPPARSTD
jgi:class 3 adenylate cyclase